MIYFMCSIFDKAAACYNPPSCVPAPGVAVRHFEDLVNGEVSIFTKHPDHFELYHVGHFNDANGEVVPLQIRELLCTGAAVAVPNKQL